MPSEREYAERLREQAYKTLSPQIKSMQEELKNLSDALSTGIRQIERKLDGINHVELPTAEVVLNEILEDVVRQKAREDKSLASFASEMRGKETQEEILGLLLDSAHIFFPSVVLFTVRSDRFSGWSSRGYSEESAREIADCSLLRSDCPQFEEALESDSLKTAPDISGIRALGCIQAQPTGARYVAPLYVLQRPVAFLYAEEGEGKFPGSDALAILADLTMLRLENITLRILYALTEETAIPEARTEPEPAAILPASGATEEPGASAESEPEPVPEPVQESEPEPVPELEPAQETETKPEYELEPAQEPAPEAPAMQAPPQETQATPEETQLPAVDEEKLHLDAKRFARLLVSEIKLYNENQVVEGRGNRDLYSRLKRDIDKSREMYQNRISPVVAQKIDYFHEEIVRILGGNDPSTLGSDYPGPRAE